MIHARTLRMLIGALLLLPIALVGAQSPAIKVVLLGTGRPDPVIDRCSTPDAGSVNACGS
jgi:hypothetical protein